MKPFVVSSKNFAQVKAAVEAKTPEAEFLGRSVMVATDEVPLRTLIKALGAYGLEQAKVQDQKEAMGTLNTLKTIRDKLNAAD